MGSPVGMCVTKFLTNLALAGILRGIRGGVSRPKMLVEEK